MLSRTVLPSLMLAALLGVPEGVSARPGAAPAARPDARTIAEQWVSDVVTRISRAAQASDRASPGGTVTIRVRIGADGKLEAATIEESSGYDPLDARALDAVKAASPFAPPPKKLLALEGYTELAFSMDLASFKP